MYNFFTGNVAVLLLTSVAAALAASYFAYFVWGEDTRNSGSNKLSAGKNCKPVAF